MIRLNIAGKIWLSIGIFVLGFVFCTALDQVQGVNTELRLRTASVALVPAANLSDRAAAAFDRAAQGFSDAVLLQDASALERGTAEGRSVVEFLHTEASLPGLVAGHDAAANRLAAVVEEFLADAQNTYSVAASHPEKMTEPLQKK